ncbi:MAG: DUF1080 domain-containing protein [Verrucomicrobiales bacterium]|nr:DUF1080 domain-containing protein [Verrucomicrobiales bacterium]
MKRFSLLLFCLVLPCSYNLANEGELIVSDDFERSESQELKDEPGKNWETNSASRAGGNKQVDLKDGAMYIFIHETADHGVSVKHPAEFTNGTVSLRFMLEDPKDELGLNFADLQYKAVHAGHLFAVRMNPTSLTIQDLKTGRMDKKMREARQNGTVTPEQNKLVKTKEKSFPAEISVGEWHHVKVQVDGDVLKVSIDEEEIASFQSEGMAHPTKRYLRLAVKRNAVVDDLKIWKR